MLTAQAPERSATPELPIYGSGIPILSGEDTGNIELMAADRRVRSVLRAVKVNLDLESTTMPTPGNLVTVLDKTDKELAVVADLCGAQVLTHEWGLWHDPRHEHKDYHLDDSLSHLVPDNHIVVAEVEVVRGALSFGLHYAEVLYPATHKRLKEGVRKYYQQDSGWLLTDAGHPQFAVSMEEVVVDGRTPPTLLDIEPRLEYVD